VKQKYDYKWYSYGAIEIIKGDKSIAFMQGDEACELAYELDNASIRSQQRIMSDYDNGSMQ
jgi:hypothetical protein